MKISKMSGETQKLLENNTAWMPFVIHKRSDFDVLNAHLLNNIHSGIPVTQQNGFPLLPWMPAINTYHNSGVKEFQSLGTHWHSPQPTSDVLKTPKNSSSQHNTSPPKSAVKCYMCDEQVNKGEFAQHLFFGSLKCNDCNVKVIDCRSFRSDLFRASKCTHNNISWLENPLEFLKSQQYDTLIAGNTNIYRYIKHLKSLKHSLPWKPVFQECRRLKKVDNYLKEKQENSKCQQEIDNISNENTEEVLLLELFDLEHMEDSVQMISLIDHDMFDIKEKYCTGVKLESKVDENNNTLQSEQNIKKEENSFHAAYIKTENITETMYTKNENILTQENKPKYVKEKVLPVKFNNILKTSPQAQCIVTKSTLEKVLLNNNLIKKIKFVEEMTIKQKHSSKRKYSEWKIKSNIIGTQHSRKTIRKIKKYINVHRNSLNESSEVKHNMNTSPKVPTLKYLEYLDLPEDGNYLVVRTPVEECPMCYEKLSILNSNFNIKLLFYTFWCQCGLKIFYVPNTPDNIEHPVKIIENKY